MPAVFNGETKVTEKPEPLFARLDPAAVMKKVAELFPAKEEEKAAPAGDAAAETEKAPLVHKSEVEYDDFAKLEFRVGKVLVCEEVPKSKKLLRFEIDFGGEKRQIVSGIKAWYRPEELVGKNVMAIVNLKPAKLAGLLSEGMLLSAEDEDGNLSLMTVERDVKAGAEIR